MGIKNYKGYISDSILAIDVRLCCFFCLHYDFIDSHGLSQGDSDSTFRSVTKPSVKCMNEIQFYCLTISEKISYFFLSKS